MMLRLLPLEIERLIYNYCDNMYRSDIDCKLFAREINEGYYYYKKYDAYTELKDKIRYYEYDNNNNINFDKFIKNYNIYA